MSGQQIARLAVPLIAAALTIGAMTQEPGTPHSPAPVVVVALPGGGEGPGAPAHDGAEGAQPMDYWSMLFVFMLSTFIGVGVIRRVSRLLHTPLMSITNAISAIAVVGSIIVTGSDHPLHIRILGAIALFASMTNIVSGFLITDRMLKMFKTGGGRK
jgi:NAD(P) transhydrogenase subunit alpha